MRNVVGRQKQTQRCWEQGGLALAHTVPLQLLHSDMMFARLVSCYCNLLTKQYRTATEHWCVQEQQQKEKQQHRCQGVNIQQRSMQAHVECYCMSLNAFAVDEGQQGRIA